MASCWLAVQTKTEGESRSRGTWLLGGVFLGLVLTLLNRGNPAGSFSCGAGDGGRGLGVLVNMARQDLEVSATNGCRC